MSRPYDSTRRAEMARHTRRRILDAAVELHARGIFHVEPLAQAAGVSAATVRKHFPNRETIFQGCTAHFLEGFRPPDLQGAAAVSEPRARVARVAAEMCRAHEQTHDLVWHAAPHADTSPAIAATLEGIAELAGAAADLVADAGGGRRTTRAWKSARRRARALLDVLTYRAFRIHTGLDAEATRGELTALLRLAVGFHGSD